MEVTIIFGVYFYCFYYNNNLKTSILHKIENKQLDPGGEQKCTCFTGNCYCKCMAENTRLDKIFAKFNCLAVCVKRIL